jgi:predicted dehydrogenase
VGSRTPAAATSFAAEHGIARAHGSWAELVADDEVDVVYVATPHPAHAEAALLALAAGKHVLVEKAFTMDAAQAHAVVDAARAEKLFAMEAMWARFNPVMAQVRRLLADGALGELTTVVADHGQWFAGDPSHRLFAPELGGGALLDLGVYPVSLASMVLGTPSAITARATMTTTGVDAQTSVLLEHPGGAHAVVTATLRARTQTAATISGTEGRIEIPTTWYAAESATFVPRVGDPQRLTSDDGPGLRHEIAEVARCVREGLTESPVMPLDETVAIMATMDEVRRQIGLTYPGLASP